MKNIRVFYLKKKSVFGDEISYIFEYVCSRNVLSQSVQIFMVNMVHNIIYYNKCPKILNISLHTFWSKFRFLCSFSLKY